MKIVRAVAAVAAAVCFFGPVSAHAGTDSGSYVLSDIEFIDSLWVARPEVMYQNAVGLHIKGESYGIPRADKPSDEEVSKEDYLAAVTRLETWAEKCLPNAYSLYKEAKLKALEIRQGFDKIFPHPYGVDENGPKWEYYKKALRNVLSAYSQFVRRRDELIHFYVLHKTGAVTAEELTWLDAEPLVVTPFPVIEELIEVSRKPMVDEKSVREWAAKNMPETYRLYEAFEKSASENSRLKRELSHDVACMDSDWLFSGLNDLNRKSGEIINALNSVGTILFDLYMKHGMGEIDAASLAVRDMELAAEMQNKRNFADVCLSEWAKKEKYSPNPGIFLLPGDVLVNGISVKTGAGNGWKFRDGVLTLEDAGPYVLCGSAMSGGVRVVVPTGVSADVVLAGLYLAPEGRGNSGFCAFSIETNASANVMLIGENVLQSGSWSGRAGIEVPVGATLAVTNVPGASVAKLTAAGRSGGAGIGGGRGSSGGTVIISGGAVTATGGGAGIGGGYKGSGGIVAISGGMVTATGAGAGIGGGYKGSGGTVTISGGTIAATGGGAGIGGGYYGSGGMVTISGGSVTAAGGLNSIDIGGWEKVNFGYAKAKVTPTNGKGTKVFCVEKSGFAPGEPVEITGLGDYGAEGIVADRDGKIRLWLPAGEYPDAAFNWNAFPLKVGK